MFCGKLTFIILVSSLVQIFNLEIFCVAIFCFRAGDKRGQYWLPNRGSGLGLNKLGLLLPTTFLPQIQVSLLQVAFALLIFLTVAHPQLTGHLSPSVLIARKSFSGQYFSKDDANYGKFLRQQSKCVCDVHLQIWALILSKGQILL